jgi:hypothetical protein
MIKKISSIAIVAFVLFNSMQSAYAFEKQGRSSFESPKHSPKENKPPQSGSQRVQDQTKSRTQKALGSTGSARQQEKTKNSVGNILRKK